MCCRAATLGTHFHFGRFSALSDLSLSTIPWSWFWKVVYSFGFKDRNRYREEEETDQEEDTRSLWCDRWPCRNNILFDSPTLVGFMQGMCIWPSRVSCDYYYGRFLSRERQTSIRTVDYAHLHGPTAAVPHVIYTQQEGRKEPATIFMAVG